MSAGTVVLAGVEPATALVGPALERLRPVLPLPLVRGLSSATDRHALIVGDDRDGVLDPAAIVGLRGPVRVVLCPMRQDRLAEYRYAARVLAGDPRPAFSLEDASLDYGALAGAYRDAGAVDLVVLPVELAEAGLPAFTRRFLLDAELGDADLSGLIGLQPPRLPDPKGLRLGVSMNPYLDTDLERAHVREFLLEFYAQPLPHLSRVLDDVARSEVIAQWREPNAAFFAEWAPGFAADVYGGEKESRPLAGTLEPITVGAAGDVPSARRSPARRVKAGVQSGRDRVRRRLLG